MPTIIVKQAFQIAINGNQVVTIEAGEQDVTDRVALVATEHLKVATLKKSGVKNGNARTGSSKAASED